MGRLHGSVIQRADRVKERVSPPRTIPCALIGLALSLAPRVRAQDPGPTDEIAVEPMVLDRVVAVVGDRLILASDIALEREIGRREPPTAGGLVWSRQDPLEALIDAAVIRGLAGDVAIYQPSSAEVRARQLALRETFEEPADYAAFLMRYGLNEDRLAGVLYAREVVERYVQRNLLLGNRGSGADPIAVTARYDAWISDARSRTAIRRVTAWSPEPAAFPQAR